MNLDDLTQLQTLDTHNMLAGIDSLPDQLASAWELGQNLPLPQVSGINRILISAVGAPGNGADLLAGYASRDCPLPVFLQRDYGLPGWAAGPETLVIALSHNGNEEEILSCFDEALKRGCRLMVICAGGKLLEKARLAGCPLWRYEYAGRPRTALAFFFGLLLALFTRLGLLPAQSELVAGAVAALKAQQAGISVAVPAARNPAKRYAGQMVGRWVTIFGSGLLAAVGRRWKNQINELAKAPANFEALPEADHNALAGVINPSSEVLMPHTMTLFLAAGCDHPRNRLRSLYTRQTFMLEGLNTDFFMSSGDSPLAQMWTAVHFGDYLAFYLAMAYAIDPTPVEALAALEAALAAQK